MMQLIKYAVIVVMLVAVSDQSRLTLKSQHRLSLGMKQKSRLKVKMKAKKLSNSDKEQIQKMMANLKKYMGKDGKEGDDEESVNKSNQQLQELLRMNQEDKSNTCSYIISFDYRVRWEGWTESATDSFYSSED